MITITSHLDFDAGHRVRGGGRCRNVHGHRYGVDVTCTAKELDDVGRVIDRDVIKARLGTWINRNWEHGMLLWDEDPLATSWVNADEADMGLGEELKYYLLPYNPTAENLAAYLAIVVWPALFADEHNPSLVQVTVHETPNFSATWIAGWIPVQTAKE